MNDRFVEKPLKDPQESIAKFREQHIGLISTLNDMGHKSTAKSFDDAAENMTDIFYKKPRYINQQLWDIRRKLAGEQLPALTADIKKMSEQLHDKNFTPPEQLIATAINAQISYMNSVSRYLSSAKVDLPIYPINNNHSSTTAKKITVQNGDKADIHNIGQPTSRQFAERIKKTVPPTTKATGGNNMAATYIESILVASGYDPEKIPERHTQNDRQATEFKKIFNLYKDKLYDLKSELEKPELQTVADTLTKQSEKLTKLLVDNYKQSIIISNDNQSKRFHEQNIGLAKLGLKLFGQTIKNISSQPTNKINNEIEKLSDELEDIVKNFRNTHSQNIAINQRTR
ncbi:MAG: hypothetical protein R3D71_09595 [Rickettsiales bacterium]